MKWVTPGGITKCPTPVGVSRWLATLSLMLLFHTPGVSAREVTFAWDANSEPVLGGYRIYYGTAHRNYTTVIDVGNQTTFTVHGLADDAMYCFAVTAYDTTRTIESAFSNEVAVMPTALSVIQGPPAGSSGNDAVLVTDWVCG
jgi:fibronectin type 3 domain-containing protein